MTGASISPFAGKTVDPSRLVNVSRLIDAYFSRTPDLEQESQRVHFGTSGHRGSALLSSFNERHILAIAQAVCLYRRRCDIQGPLFLGIDTHALSRPAFATALEVFAANGVTTMIDDRDGYTPTPVISHAILTHNRLGVGGLADGVVLTPSHNPPEDGGFKYNPPSGGPADTTATTWIENTANRLLEHGLAELRRIPYEQARRSENVKRHDYITSYVGDLARVVDVESVRASGLSLGIDPLGGASVDYWAAIVERYGLAATIVETTVDPTFGFMPADWDGRIRMDCSSPYAMARLIALRDRFDVALANDTDADRHGVVTRSGGLMQPNQYLAAAISFLFQNRPAWGRRCGVGKTMVSSGIIDRVAARLDRTLMEVPVGFKWFVDGLRDGSLGFAGEESAGASLLRRDGAVWTTDKDGIALGLLAAEITARTGLDPGQQYARLTEELGQPFYERIDTAATQKQMDVLRAIVPVQLAETVLAGEPILAKLIAAPANGAPFGGIKVTTRTGWFAARPSGTEAIYKLYAESFQDAEHLEAIEQEAQTMIGALFEDSGT